ncbi:MAG: hypothetical protein U0U69_12595 [Acidimicrobiia bacterium]
MTCASSSPPIPRFDTPDAWLLREPRFAVMVKHDLSKNPGRWRPGGLRAGPATGRVV